MAEPSKEELRSTKGHTAADLGMDDAAVACRVCGVSYLIFSEVKQLEKKLRESEAKVLRLTKQIEKEKAEVKKAFTTFQVDALEQKQGYNASLKEQQEKIAQLTANAEKAQQSTFAAVEAAVAAEAAKRQAAVEEATKRSQKQLLVEMSHKADLRSYLRQLPHYLASVRRLQHERDHLKSLVADLRHTVAERMQAVSNGMGRMSASLKQADARVDATRRELNAQLAVEVERLNAKAGEHAKAMGDLENQVQMLQSSLAEARKAATDQTAAAQAAASREAAWTTEVAELKAAGKRFEETAKQNEVERARAIAGLQGELQAARAEAQKYRTTLQQEQGVSARRLKQAGAAEQHAAAVAAELAAAQESLQAQQKATADVEHRAAAEAGALRAQLASLQGGASEREAQLLEAARAAEARVEEAVGRAKSWQATAEDSAKVHAAELAAAQSHAAVAATAAQAAHAREVEGLRRQLAAAEAAKKQLQADGAGALAQERAALEKKTLAEVEAATRELQREHGEAFARAQAASERETGDLRRQLEAALQDARQADQSAADLDRARARVAELEAALQETRAGGGTAEEVAELNGVLEQMRGLLVNRDREIERLEDIVHRECLERTDLLARIRDLERG